MKRFIVLFLVLATFGISEAQTFVDCPTLMKSDTLAARAWAKYDIPLNVSGSYTNETILTGPVDLDFLVSSASATETVTLVAFGLKRKLAAGVWTVYPSADSVAVGTITATTTPILYSYAIDNFWASFKLYDAIRVTVKVSASDPTCTFKLNLRVWPQGNSTGFGR